MALPPAETTRLTEALENNTKELVKASQEVTQLTERWISDATRHGGRDATATDFFLNWARVGVASLLGSVRLADTFLGNLVLITDPGVQHWVSEPLDFGATPGPGQRWELEVLSVRDSKKRPLPAQKYRLFAGGRPVSTNSPSPTPLDGSWTGDYLVRPLIDGQPPGEITIEVRAVDADDRRTETAPAVTDWATIQRDMTLVGT